MYNMRYIAILILLVLFNTAWGQAKHKTLQTGKHKQHYTAIRTKFKQGTMQQYIAKNCKYPDVARENNIEGRVIVQFMIDEQGKVCHVQLLSKSRLGGGCEEEALRLIKAMPDWIPGQYRKRKVRTVETVRIGFRLE